MKTNRSVERAISVLMFVCQSDRPMRLTEISQGTGLDKATTLRFLHTLANADMVRHETNTKCYVQGAGIYNFWPSEIRKICRPHLKGLLERTQETICLIVPRGIQRVCIDVIEPDRELRIVAPVGRELPIYAGASGRVFMAQKSDSQIEKILQDSNLAPLTVKSVADRELYRQQLEDVKLSGFAHNVGEVALDTSAIAAPVFDGLGNTAAAVVLRGPGTRITQSVVGPTSSLVKAAAAAISGELANIHQ